jgi:uncharacterized membrane protein YhdT
MDNRNMQDRTALQSRREALLTLGAYALFFLWWYATAYGLGDGDPENYSYVLGLPAWFFYSCVVGYVALSLVLWLMVRLFFKDIPLDDVSGSAGKENGKPGENTAERRRGGL